GVVDSWPIGTRTIYAYHPYVLRFTFYVLRFVWSSTHEHSRVSLDTDAGGGAGDSGGEHGAGACGGPAGCARAGWRAFDRAGFGRAGGKGLYRPGGWG